VRFIDDVDLVARRHRAIAHAIEKLAHFLDLAAAGGVEFEHVYVEASTQTPCLSGYENAWNVIKTLPPDRVVALVDGDDWLPTDDVLAHVEYMHHLGAWVTYGSFEYSDGRPGFAAEWGGRDAPWTATHLKTFRAGLFQRVRHQEHNRFHEHAWDILVMVPMLEMAAERATFCSRLMYVYNFASSYERKASPTELGQLRRAAEWVKTQKPYARVDAL
jgi:hypothetical protein